MATDEEKIAAVQAGLDALPSDDRQNSVKRFVAMWNALEPFLPKPEPLPEQVPEATLLVSFKPTDEMRPQVDRINNELWTLIKQVPSQGDPPAEPPVGDQV